MLDGTELAWCWYYVEDRWAVPVEIAPIAAGKLIKQNAEYVALPARLHELRLYDVVIGYDNSELTEQ